MFGYLRLFSILSLLAVIVVAVLSGMAFRTMAADNITQMVQKNHAMVAQGYVAEVWKKYRDAVGGLNAANAAQAKDDPRVLEFAQATVSYFQHMSYMRVNIYNGQGLLLLTTNMAGARQLAGGVSSPDAGFVTQNMKQTAALGHVLSGVAMAGGEGAAMQTLVPIRTDQGEADGAVEIISDVSAPWDRLMDFQIYGTGQIILIFLAFVGIWFITSRKAEAIIAKQHDANLELAATAAAAQAENREKSQFLANISHELRTPLNAIIGFSDIIKTEATALIQEKKYFDYMVDIHSSGVHLLSLINDILDYSKAEAGKLEMEVSEVNATKIIQNCMRLVSPRAESSKVKLVESLPKEAIIMITDGKKFKQILLNLLSNAVKFTPNFGTVQVSAWHNIAEDTFSFEVKDSGIGIAPKDISVAMSPFGQVDNKLSRKFEGTGLGLPLTKKFVELMGGKFNIQSKVNVGTTITFSMPRELKEREGLVIKQIA